MFPILTLSCHLSNVIYDRTEAGGTVHLKPDFRTIESVLLTKIFHACFSWFKTINYLNLSNAVSAMIFEKINKYLITKIFNAGILYECFLFCTCMLPSPQEFQSNEVIVSAWRRSCEIQPPAEVSLPQTHTQEKACSNRSLVWCFQLTESLARMDSDYLDCPKKSGVRRDRLGRHLKLMT